MNIYKYIAFLLACITCLHTAKGQPKQTADYISLTSIYDSNGNSVQMIPVDGSTCTLIFSLNGGKDNVERLYTAYNLDVQLPFGMEVCQENGVPSVSLPSDFSFYASGIGSLTHSLSASILGNGNVRIACFSGRNANFSKTSGVLFQMLVRITSPYVCPGTHDIKIMGQNLTVRENAQKYVPADRAESVSIAEGEASLQLVIPSETCFSTCVLPFDTTPPAGVMAFTCSAYADETVYLQRVNSLQAYKPYILYAATGYSGTLTGTLSADAYQVAVTDGMVRSGYLCGAISPQNVTTGFVLQQLEEGLKFYFTAGETFLIPSGKCWLEISKSNARVLSFQVVDSEAGIPFCEEKKGKLTPIYDLSGRKILFPLKGIYIQKNRKFVK